MHTYHKFWVVGQDEPVEAQNLKKDMKIIKHSLPVINSNEKIIKYAYTHGLFCADGTTSSFGEPKRCSYTAKENGLCMRHQLNEKEYEKDGTCQANSYSEQKWLDLYHEKKELMKHATKTSKFVDANGWPTVEESDWGVIKSIN